MMIPRDSDAIKCPQTAQGSRLQAVYGYSRSVGSGIHSGSYLALSMA